MKGPAVPHPSFINRICTVLTVARMVPRRCRTVLMSLSANNLTRPQTPAHTERGLETLSSERTRSSRTMNSSSTPYSLSSPSFFAASNPDRA